MEVGQWIALAGVLLVALGMILAGRKWVDSKIETERHERGVQIGAALAEAKKAQDTITTFQIKAAETYATKAGVSDAIDRMTDALKDIGTRVDKKLDTMTDRLDRVIENNGRAKAD